MSECDISLPVFSVLMTCVTPPPPMCPTCQLCKKLCLKNKQRSMCCGFSLTLQTIPAATNATCLDSSTWTRLLMTCRLRFIKHRSASAVSFGLSVTWRVAAPSAGLQRKGSLWSPSGSAGGLRGGSRSPSSTAAARAPPEERGQKEATN